MPDKFAFVLADEHGKAKKSDNVLVRSHCMLGKNKRIDSRRSRRQCKRMASRTNDNRHEPGNDPISGNPNPYPLASNPAADLDTVPWVDTMDDRSRRTLYKFLSYSASNSPLYPFERFFDFHVLPNYVLWLCQDRAFFHSVLLTICAIDDFTMRQGPTSRTCHHLRNTLSNLNARLGETNGFAMETITFIIITLATCAGILEDHGASGTHIKGLQQVVQLRGGYKFLHEHPKVYFKITRLDLSWCLSTGHKPHFLPATGTWEPFFRGSHPVVDHGIEEFSIDYTKCPKLATVYKDLRTLANLINERKVDEVKMSGQFFQAAFHSIQTRLLGLQDTLQDEVAECFRLGMLAFLATSFCLPGRKMTYPYLALRVRKVLEKLRASTSATRHIVLWVLVISIIAIFESDESWIQDTWNSVVEKEMLWAEARKTLQAIAWIVDVHDEAGQKAFNVLRRRMCSPLFELKE